MDYIFSGYLVFSLCLARASGNCGKDIIHHCMQPIHTLRYQLGVSDDLPYFPIYSLKEYQFGEYCEAAKQTYICLNGLRDCEDRNLFMGLRDATKYLCEETLEEYKSHQSCYANSNMIPGLEGCHRQTMSHVESVDIHSADAKSKLCGYVTEAYKCIIRVVKSECGQEATEWQVTYVRKFLHPTQNAVNCTESHWGIYSLLSVGASFIIIITVIAVLRFRVCKRKAAQDGENSINFHNVLSEPNNTPQPDTMNGHSQNDIPQPDTTNGHSQNDIPRPDTTSGYSQTTTALPGYSQTTAALPLYELPAQA